MSDKVDPNDVTSDWTSEYEAPAVFDLGAVLDVTNGSSSGSSDDNGQGQN